MRRINELERDQRAMQARLKCDRVPSALGPIDGFQARVLTGLAGKRLKLQWDKWNRSMPTTADFDAGRLTRSLLRRSRQGALATLMAGSGDPYCSLVNV